MTLFGTIRNKILSKNIEKRSFEYFQNIEDKKRLNFQLEKFNKHWQKIIKIPYYSGLVKKGIVPNKFESWSEFVEKVPVTTKKVIQDNKNNMTDKSRKSEFTRITGGTTAQPVQLPSWNSEMKEAELDLWTARSWYEINPKSRLFLIWGHSHLLGTGVSGKINGFKRKLKDKLLGYYRFSAYNINREKMRLAAEVMLKFQPDYVIGYSVALDNFIRVNKDLIDKLGALKLKVVVGTAESFPKEDSESIINEIFNCPVGMEYGSAETNLVAHTHPDGGYKVFWQNYFVEAIDNGQQKGKIIRITSLYPRCFPLIRYEIGDEVELYDGDNGLGISRLKKVIGRCNLFALMPDGSKIHSEAFTHCVRDVQGINQYQILQEKDKIRLLLIVNDKYIKENEKEIKSRLVKINKEFNNMNFEYVTSLKQTISGKTPMVIRKDNEDSN